MKRSRWSQSVAVLGLVAILPALTPAVLADTCSPGFGLCTPSDVVVYANPHWSIQLTSYGYSDFVIYQLPPFPRWDPRDPGGVPPLHELFSGEWAFAISYNGTVIWLEPCFIYPDWRTNSNFVIEVPINFSGDSDGDGVFEGFSIISNGMVRIRIDYDFELATDGTNYGTAMGRGALGTAKAPYRLSDKWVLIQRFTVENISGSPLNDVRLYGMAAPHPANTEYAGTSGAYDVMMYNVGGFTDYFWDLTAEATNSGLTDGFPTGSLWDDAVNYAVNTTVGAFDIDTYRGHQFGDPGITMDPVDANNNGLKPLCGTHCNIENMTMNNATLLTDVEFAAGFRLDGGTLAKGATWQGDVLLSVASRAIGQPSQACGHLTETGADPILTMSKGLCRTPVATTLTYDVVMGSTYELSRVSPCGTGPMGNFDCTALINLECKVRQYGLDAIQLDDDAHVTDTLYYLARVSQVFGSYGMGNNIPGAPDPLLRFYFTSQTAPIDVCDPSLARSSEAQNSPGVGRLEEVGLGVRSPRRP